MIEHHDCNCSICSPKVAAAPAPQAEGADADAMKVAREIHEMHFQAMKAQGLNIEHRDCEPKIAKVAALLSRHREAQTRELRAALKDAIEYMPDIPSKAEYECLLGGQL